MAYSGLNVLQGSFYNGLGFGYTVINVLFKADLVSKFNLLKAIQPVRFSYFSLPSFPKIKTRLLCLLLILSVK